MTRTAMRIAALTALLLALASSGTFADDAQKKAVDQSLKQLKELNENALQQQKLQQKLQQEQSQEQQKRQQTILEGFFGGGTRPR